MNQNYQIKAENEVTDKKFAFTAAVAWPWFSHGLEKKIACFHCAFFAGKTIKYSYRLGKVKSTLHN
jgi:hypothetical protein